MVVANPEFARAEEEILSIVGRVDGPYSPVAVIDEMKRKQFSEYITRIALWHLIDRGKLTLTMQRMVMLPGSTASL